MASGQEDERLNFEEAPSSFKSTVWSHFGFSVKYDEQGTKTVSKQNTVCKHCFATLGYSSGNTSNMMAHLRRNHPGINLSGTRPITKTQQSIPAAFQQQYSTHSEKHKSITRGIGVYIAKDMQPYSVVNDRGFRFLMKLVEPRYSIPSHTHFSDKIIPELYEVSRSEVESELRQAQFLALSTDSWTSRGTTSYLTVTVHFVADWEIKCYVLQTRPVYESHTSTHLAHELMQAVTEWKLERANVTIPVTTDNAPNIVNAIRDTRVFGPHVACFAHTLNLAAKKAVALSAVSRILGMIRRVVTFFHKSTTAAHVLTKKQQMLSIPEHKLIHDVPTRWNTARHA